MCVRVVFPCLLSSDYSPAIPGVYARPPQAGNPLSVCIQALHSPRERRTHTRARACTYVLAFFFLYTALYTARVYLCARVRIEVQQPPGPVGPREQRREMGEREGER